MISKQKKLNPTMTPHARILKSQLETLLLDLRVHKDPHAT